MTEQSLRVSSFGKGPSYRWVVIGLFLLLMVVWIMVDASLGVMLPQMSSDLSFSALEGGWLGSMSWLNQALFAFVFGIWLSNYSFKITIFVCALLAGFFALLQALAPTYPLELAARAFFMLSLVSLRPLNSLIVQQWFGPKEVATVNGLISSSFSLGQALGFGLTPLLMLYLGGWRNSFYLFAALLFFVAFLWLTFSRERHTSHYRIRAESQQGTALGAVVKYKTLWLLSFCQIGVFISYTSFITFWPTFALNYLGIPLTTAGPLMSLFPIGSIAGAISAGIISDKIGLRKPLMWIPGLVLPVLFVGLLLTDFIPLLAVLLITTGFFSLVMVPPMLAYPYELPGIKPREVVAGIGLFTSISTASGAVGPPLAGFLYESTGSLQTALTICGLLAVTLAVIPQFLPETGWRARRLQMATE